MELNAWLCGEALNMGNPVLGRLKMNRKSNLIISLSVCIFRMIPAGQVGAVTGYLRKEGQYED